MTKRTLFLSLAAFILILTLNASAQVAYVYVSTAPTSTTFEIKAYAASSSGTLATVSGLPSIVTPDTSDVAIITGDPFEQVSDP